MTSAPCCRQDRFWHASIIWSKQLAASLLISTARFLAIRIMSNVAVFLHARSMALRPVHPPPWLSCNHLCFSESCMNPLLKYHFHRMFKLALMRCSVRSRLILGCPGSFSRYMFQIVLHRWNVCVCLTARTRSR